MLWAELLLKKTYKSCTLPVLDVLKRVPTALTWTGTKLEGELWTDQRQGDAALVYDERQAVSLPFSFLGSVITRFVCFLRSTGTCQAKITERG